MAQRQKMSFGTIVVEGEPIGGGVRVLLRDPFNNILYAIGMNVPTDNSKGYAKGCIFIKADATENGFYVNIGNATACNFRLVQVAP